VTDGRQLKVKKPGRQFLYWKLEIGNLKTLTLHKLFFQRTTALMPSSTMSNLDNDWSVDTSRKNHTPKRKKANDEI
jgi:hypothetical protein